MTSPLSSMDPASLASYSSGASLEATLEGYEHEFVPPLEARYECPICLLVLREPRQTKCGHRFCRDCIVRALRDSSSRCPVDNEPLSEVDLFPDNFAKREILNFNIRCPNNKDGCETILPLGKLQLHMGECPLALTPCPNKCACIVHRRDVKEHVTKHCCLRKVNCHLCDQAIRASEMEHHLSTCPHAIVACEFCRREMSRSQVKQHLRVSCGSVMVNCSFHRLGCSHKMLRSEEDAHLKEAVPSHMKQLCHSVSSILTSVHGSSLVESLDSQSVNLLNLSGTLDRSHEDSFTSNTDQAVSLQVLLDSIQFSDSSSSGIPESLSSSPCRVSNGKVVSVNMDNSNSSSHQRVGSSSSDTSSHQLNQEFFDGEHRIWSTHLSSSSLPCQDMIAHSSNNINRPNHHAQSTSGYVSDPSRTNQPCISSSLPTNNSTLNPQFCPLVNNQRHHVASAFNQNQKLLDVLKHFDMRIGQQQRQFDEVKSKLEVAQQSNKDLQGKVTCLESKLDEKDAQLCGGDFYWQIPDFSNLKQRLSNGEAAMLHSPPFYTSPWGYCMCLRANIANSTPGGPHLSLFVHLMQGKYDHFLSWPFSDRIKLTVVDQNPQRSKRVSLKETLEPKPQMAAFQKPTTPRNHKGYGYTDFVALSTLDQGSYLVDDLLVVHVKVASTDS